MKKLLLIATVATSTLFFSACGNETAGDANKTDSTATVIPPPDNSAATNPSMADTNYSKNQDTSAVKKDSLKK